MHTLLFNICTTSVGFSVVGQTSVAVVVMGRLAEMFNQAVLRVASGREFQAGTEHDAQGVSCSPSQILYDRHNPDERTL